ncbi:MAG: 50S ribosomal protein L17 [Desulfobacterota bacterium]|nr:50S ribosomal protein L17 [Thermodesulfobacteriota bacterium]MDW8002402.1 50S ribosomal protein L17 [Deltaproteobacteria bacterium]
MRHLDKVKKLNRTKSHRVALLRNLATSLFIHESIKTTKAKAMALKSYAERLITLAKRKDLHSMRMAFSALRNKEAVKKLFSDIGERFKDVNGGYIRVLNLGTRKGDCARMALIELTRKKEKKQEEKK